MAADELRVTNVKDFRDAVHEILDAPPPSSASNLWHLGRVVFVDVKGRDLGRPRPEAPHCSLELITVVVPSLQQAFIFDVSAHTHRTPGELVCLAAPLHGQSLLKPAQALCSSHAPRESATPRPPCVPPEGWDHHGSG
jgi:hypothetical protein